MSQGKGVWERTVAEARNEDGWQRNESPLLRRFVEAVHCESILKKRDKWEEILGKSFQLFLLFFFFAPLFLDRARNIYIYLYIEYLREMIRLQTIHAPTAPSSFLPNRFENTSLERTLLLLFNRVTRRIPLLWIELMADQVNYWSGWSNHNEWV